MRWAKFTLALFLLLMCKGASAQSFTVDKVRNLDFGTFSVNRGGNISIASHQDARTSTGDVILMGSSYGCAIYHISTTSTTPITIQIDRPAVRVTGPNGATASLEYGVAYPEFPVVVAGSPAIVRIGGVLHLGSRFVNPSGTYSGTGLIDFTIHNE